VFFIFVIFVCFDWASAWNSTQGPQWSGVYTRAIIASLQSRWLFNNNYCIRVGITCVCNSGYLCPPDVAVTNIIILLLLFGLQGQLPASLGHLNLFALVAEQNSLTGSIPESVLENPICCAFRCKTVSCLGPCHRHSAKQSDCSNCIWRKMPWKVHFPHS
jgi:hypothetical protein